MKGLYHSDSLPNLVGTGSTSWTGGQFIPNPLIPKARRQASRPPTTVAIKKKEASSKTVRVLTSGLHRKVLLAIVRQEKEMYKKMRKCSGRTRMKQADRGIYFSFSNISFGIRHNGIRRKTKGRRYLLPANTQHPRTFPCPKTERDRGWETYHCPLPSRPQYVVQHLYTHIDSLSFLPLLYRPPASPVCLPC